MARPSQIDAIRTQIRKQQTKPVTSNNPLDLEALAARIVSGGKKPLNPTQKSFIFDVDERVKLYMGPVGCAKTSTLVGSAILGALMLPGSVWGAFRAHWWEVEATLLPKFEALLANLGPGFVAGKKSGPPFRIFLKSIFPGEPPSEILFHGLDESEKLGSLILTGAIVDEVNELDEHLITTLNGRLRHQLPSQSEPEGPFYLHLACNPVNRSHWIHRKFCGESDCDLIPWGKKYKPNPRENVGNLPPNYYETIGAGYSPELKIRFIEGECGPDPAGQPVFPEFRHSLHVGDLRYIPKLPMIRGWDFGRRRPAVVWAQVTPEGYVNRHKAILGDNELLEHFTERVKQISSIEFPLVSRWIDFVDPHSGPRKDDVADVSRIDILRKHGLSPQYRNVSIDTGIAQMSLGLSTLIRNRPRAMYDRNGCSILIEGYAGGYTYPMPRPGHALKETPVADGYYEHVMDADRYIAVNLGLGSTTDPAKHKRNLRVVRNNTTGY